MRRASLVVFLIASLAATASGQDARSYAVSGSDTFSIGGGDVTSEVTFTGTQRLRWHDAAGGTRFVNDVSYRRVEQGSASTEHARYVSDLTLAGEQHDRLTHDPEYLSVLNQPFSVRLDVQTLADLRRLRSDVPFDFPSPMTGATLHGRLRHLGEAMVDGRLAVGVGFAAAGRMSGSLPDRPSLAIRGAIALRGAAYYDAETALLLASRTTVTIVGNVTNPGSSNAVHITYERAIRAGTAPLTLPAAITAPREASPTPGTPAAPVPTPS